MYHFFTPENVKISDFPTFPGGIETENGAKMG